MTQYSRPIRPKRSDIHAQAVYFLHSTIPSVTCLRLSDVTVICCAIYFQLPIQSAFLLYIGRQADQHCGVLLVLIRNIGHRTLPKIWVGRLPVQSVHPRKKL